MRPDESLRVKCVELAIAAGCPDRPGSGLIAFASVIEQYLTGKTAIELAKLAQPALLTDAQKAAVRQIVAEMLGTMFDGADGRVREAIAAAIVVDPLGQISGAATSSSHHRGDAR